MADQRCLGLAVTNAEGQIATVVAVYDGYGMWTFSSTEDRERLARAVTTSLNTEGDVLLRMQNPFPVSSAYDTLVWRTTIGVGWKLRPEDEDQIVKDQRKLQDLMERKAQTAKWREEP